jgi:hypothetical protein
MFCPQCGINQSDELKFCKSCGANLYAVRQAVSTGEPPRKPSEEGSWGKNAANWMQYQAELVKLKYDRERKMTPEEKRVNEIKAGVITSSIGVGLMIFLYVFMQGLILSGKIPFDTAQILSRIWIAGVIPVFVGAGLLINGVFVSRKLIELKKRELQEKEITTRLAPAHDSKDELSPSADWYESDSPKPSVTEHTTRQLENFNQMK